MNRDEFSDIIEDFKQYVDAAVKREVKQAIGELREEVDERFDTVDGKLNTVLDAVGERFEDSDKKLKDHERRITRLEHT